MILRRLLPASETPRWTLRSLPTVRIGPLQGAGWWARQTRATAPGREGARQGTLRPAQNPPSRHRQTHWGQGLDSQHSSKMNKGKNTFWYVWSQEAGGWKLDEQAGMRKSLASLQPWSRKLFSILWGKKITAVQSSNILTLRKGNQEVFIMANSKTDALQ